MWNTNYETKYVADSMYSLLPVMLAISITPLVLIVTIAIVLSVKFMQGIITFLRGRYVLGNINNPLPDETPLFVEKSNTRPARHPAFLK